MISRCVFVVLVLMAFNASVDAATYPVDDGGSRVREPIVRTKWVDTAPGRGSSAAITGVLLVDVELDTTAWNGKPGKIYMLLAPASAYGMIQASWAVQNDVLLPGRMQSGDRVLVFNGTIPADRLRDTLTITLLADGNRVVRPETINFTFEIETP